MAEKVAKKKTSLFTIIAADLRWAFGVEGGRDPYPHVEFPTKLNGLIFCLLNLCFVLYCVPDWK